MALIERSSEPSRIWLFRLTEADYGDSNGWTFTANPEVAADLEQREGWEIVAYERSAQ